MRNMLKLMICLILGLILAMAFNSYGHEHAYYHIHIKGKITAVDGKPVEGAELKNVYALREYLTGLPGDFGVVACYHIDPSGNATTAIKPRTLSGGNYHFVIMFTKAELIKNYFDRIGIDKSKMRWGKDGYDIKPK